MTQPFKEFLAHDPMSAIYEVMQAQSNAHQRRHNTNALYLKAMHRGEMAYEASLAEHMTSSEAKVLVTVAMLSPIAEQYPNVTQSNRIINAFKCLQLTEKQFLNHCSYLANPTRMVSANRSMIRAVLRDLKHTDVYMDQSIFSHMYSTEFDSYTNGTVMYKEMVLRHYALKSADWTTSWAKRKAFEANYLEQVKQKIHLADLNLVEKHMDRSPETTETPFCVAQQIIQEYEGQEDGHFAIQGKDLEMVNRMLDYMPIPNRLSAYVMDKIITEAQAIANFASMRHGPSTYSQELVKAKMCETVVLDAKGMESMFRAAVQDLLAQKKSLQAVKTIG